MGGATPTYGRRVESTEVDPPQNGDEPVEVDPPQEQEESVEVDPPQEQEESVELHPPCAGLTGHYTTVPGVPPAPWCPKRRRTTGGSQGPSKQPAPNKRHHPRSRRQP